MGTLPNLICGKFTVGRKDNLPPDIYDYQQQKYVTENTFSLFSFVGMALLELGVIVECDEETVENI